MHHWPVATTAVQKETVQFDIKLLFLQPLTQPPKLATDTFYFCVTNNITMCALLCVGFMVPHLLLQSAGGREVPC